MLLALSRKLVPADHHVRQGWRAGSTPSLAPMPPLDDLLARSDAMTLHAPLTPQARGILGRRELSLLPRGGPPMRPAC